jgi:hypothetical protein
MIRIAKVLAGAVSANAASRHSWPMLVLRALLPDSSRIATGYAPRVRQV